MTVRRVSCWDIGMGCAHAIPCAHLLPKSPLRASVKMALLVARIGAQNDPFMHPFQNDPFMHPFQTNPFSESLKTNIWIQNFGCTTGCYPVVLITTAIGFHHPTLVYEGVYNRNHSSCNLNPNGVGGQGHALY